MYAVTSRPGPVDLVVLSDGSSGSTVELAPARGGLVTRFETADGPVLALDEATLLDPSKNVRGGIPILFPAAGRLANDRYVRAGRAHPMKQHGFARSLPWAEVARGSGGDRGAWITLALEASPETARPFPFDFRLDFTFSLAGRTLTIEQAYANRGAEPMPLHAGFHPYFHVPDAGKGETRVDTAATRAFDNVTKTEVSLRGIDLTLPEVDLHLLDHGAASSALLRPGAPTIAIEGSPEMTRWVVWTLAGKDFVCVEPWTAPADALNTGDGLLWVAPGEARRLRLRISHGSPVGVSG